MDFGPFPHLIRLLALSRAQGFELRLESQVEDMRNVRKITIGQAVKQGDVTLEIWCVGPGKGAPCGGGPNACGHHSAMPITRAIELFGEATSLRDLRVRCTACGSREVDARTNSPRQVGARWFYEWSGQSMLAI